MIFISAVLMTVVLAFGLRAGRDAGFAKWNQGLALYALAWLLIASRGVLSAIVGIALADALLLAGLCFQFGALIEFSGRAAPRWLFIAPAPVLFAMLLPILDRYVILTFATSAAYATLFTVTGGYVLRLGSSAGPVRWLLAPILLASAAALLLRAGYVALDADSRPGIFAGSNAVDTLTFILMFIATVAVTFGFLIMHRERAEQALRSLAMHDALTGLLNRRAFAEQCERELARARRAGAGLAMLLLDLDHFKMVNDSFGHRVGDRVLVDLAARLKRWRRAADVVGRYGGEEFCILLPDTGAADATAVAERMRAGIAAEPLGGVASPVTASIGVAACASTGQVDLDFLIVRADEALYEAKRAGRNRVVVADLSIAPRLKG